MTSGSRFIRFPELRRLVGLSRSTVYARMEAGTFPAKIDLGGHLVAWREREVAEWLEDPASWRQPLDKAA